MHIHIQNRPTNSFVSITRDMVDAAMGSTGDHFSISDTDDGFAAALSSMDVLVTTADQIKLRFPCEAPRLKAVFLLHAGLNGLDANNPLPAEVMLLNNSGTHSRKAGEYVAMAALMLVNDMPLYADQQHQRVWRPRLTSTLAGRRVAILGVGGLGAGAARALRPFDVHLTGIRTSSAPHEDFDEIVPMDGLASVLGRTDLLVLAAPLTRSTRGIVGRTELAMLPAHAGLINIGRGEVLDQAALIDALSSGRLAGAVLDVQQVEPVPADDPLWTAPNLVLTPHVSATDSEHFGRDTLTVLRTNLEALARGERPPNLVDLGRGY